MNKNSEKIMRVQKRKKLFAVERFGGKCVICGYNKNPSALCFHHKDDNKEQKPSYIISRWAWERAKKELDKCILVCLNCHAEIHDGINGIKDIVTRIPVADWKIKKCPICGEEFETKTEGIYCSQECFKFSTRKVERPTREELIQLLDAGTKWYKMGKMFGVSDTTVKKWAIKYGIVA